MISPLAVHIGNTTPRLKPRGTQWRIVLPAMLLVLGLIYWGVL